MKNERTLLAPFCPKIVGIPELWFIVVVVVDEFPELIGEWFRELPVVVFSSQYLLDSRWGFEEWLVSLKAMISNLNFTGLQNQSF